MNKANKQARAQQQLEYHLAQSYSYFTDQATIGLPTSFGGIYAEDEEIN